MDDKLCKPSRDMELLPSTIDDDMVGSTKVSFFPDSRFLYGAPVMSPHDSITNIITNTNNMIVPTSIRDFNIPITALKNNSFLFDPLSIDIFSMQMHEGGNHQTQKQPHNSSNHNSMQMIQHINNLQAPERPSFTIAPSFDVKSDFHIFDQSQELDGLDLSIEDVENVDGSKLHKNESSIFRLPTDSFILPQHVSQRNLTSASNLNKNTDPREVDLIPSFSLSKVVNPEAMSVDLQLLLSARLSVRLPKIRSSSRGSKAGSNGQSFNLADLIDHALQNEQLIDNGNSNIHLPRSPMYPKYENHLTGNEVYMPTVKFPPIPDAVPLQPTNTVELENMLRIPIEDLDKKMDKITLHDAVPVIKEATKGKTLRASEFPPVFNFDDIPMLKNQEVFEFLSFKNLFVPIPKVSLELSKGLVFRRKRPPWMGPLKIDSNASVDVAIKTSVLLIPLNCSDGIIYGSVYGSSTELSIANTFLHPSVQSRFALDEEKRELVVVTKLGHRAFIIYFPVKDLCVRERVVGLVDDWFEAKNVDEVQGKLIIGQSFREFRPCPTCNTLDGTCGCVSNFRQVVPRISSKIGSSAFCANIMDFVGDFQGFGCSYGPFDIANNFANVYVIPTHSSVQVMSDDHAADTRRYVGQIITVLTWSPQGELTLKQERAADVKKKRYRALNDSELSPKRLARVMRNREFARRSNFRLSKKNLLALEDKKKELTKALEALRDKNAVLRRENEKLRANLGENAVKRILKQI